MTAEIVDVVYVNNEMWTVGWERGERGKKQGVGQLLPDKDQGEWGFVTMSKKLALQVSNVGSLS